MLVCQRLQCNAYRILGVSASSTPAQVFDAAAALRRSAMLGLAPPEIDCFGEIARSEAAIRTALGNLSNAPERLQHRLFWFDDSITLDGAVGAGPRRTLPAPHAAHERALRALATAYYSENLGQLIASLRGWHGFLSKPDCRMFLGGSESGGAAFEPAATAEEMEALRAQAMAFAAEPLAAAARSAWAQSAIAVFRGYLEALAQLADTGEWATACRGNLLLPLTRGLRNACTIVREKYRPQVVRRDDAAAGNGTVVAAELQYFRRFVEPAWRDIAAVLAEDAEEARLARGDAADLLHLIALDHAWADAFAVTEELAVEAVALAEGTVQEDRIRRNLAKYVRASAERALGKALHIFNSQFSPALGVTPGVSLEPRAEDAVASAAALKFYRDSIEPVLRKLLKQYADDPPGCEQWRRTAAACLLQVAEGLATAEEFLQAEERMVEALGWAEGTQQSAMLQAKLTSMRTRAEQAAARKAEEAVALEAMKAVRQHARALANWRGKVLEQPGYGCQNQAIANEELRFFEAHLQPALHQAMALLGDEDLRMRALRVEAAQALAEIAIHLSWAGEIARAEALIERALEFAPGTDAAAGIQQEYRRRGALLHEISEAGGTDDASSDTTAPYAVGRNLSCDPFPGRMPLFAADSWRLGAVVTVLIVVLIACLGGFDSDGVTAGTSHSLISPPQLPVPRIVQVVRRPPAIDMPSVVEKQGALTASAGPAELRLRELQVQIHAEERTAQQIERQLIPLRNEIDSMKRYANETSQPESAALQDKAGIYARLLERQQVVVAQWKQNTQIRDRLMALRAQHVTVEAAKEKE